MDEQGIPEIEKENVKFWYDGFTFGTVSDIYNPWSVISYLDKRKYDTYWANTSGNGLIGKLIREGNQDIKSDFEELLKLPGVGRKSANLVMGDVFGKPAIVTDTHCIRLANRIGLVKNEKDPKSPEKDPKKVEMQLWNLIPPEEGNVFCHRLVLHGRQICTARTKPHCDLCSLNDLCRSAFSYE